MEFAQAFCVFLVNKSICRCVFPCAKAEAFKNESHFQVTIVRIS